MLLPTQWLVLIFLVLFVWDVLGIWQIFLTGLFHWRDMCVIVCIVNIVFLFYRRINNNKSKMTTRMYHCCSYWCCRWESLTEFSTFCSVSFPSLFLPYFLFLFFPFLLFLSFVFVLYVNVVIINTLHTIQNTGHPRHVITVTCIQSPS